MEIRFGDIVEVSEPGIRLGQRGNVVDISGSNGVISVSFSDGAVAFFFESEVTKIDSHHARDYPSDENPVERD